MKYIDTFLNTITMYRLVLYYLFAIVIYAVIASGLHLLPFDPFAFMFSLAFMLGVGVATNAVFARVFKVAANVESIYISVLILALIISPLKSYADLPWFFWAAVWMAASKFIFAIRKQHLFNPVAIAVVIVAFALNQSATWWVGNSIMLPVVVLGGLLMVRKIRRQDLVLAFLLTALATCTFLGLLRGTDPLLMIRKTLLDSPLFFFAFVMLTEPLTTPPTHRLQLYYGALTGFLFAPQLHLGSLYTTPEIALVLGNVFSYLVGPKVKLTLRLQQKLQLSPDIYDYIFTPDRAFNFTPGQYLEWTLGHAGPDDRGNRRYFTLASAPTEKTVRLGVKFYQPASSYKRALTQMVVGDTLAAGQLAGDFTLPSNPQTKLVFIAGGIGITPFRSMLQYLIDRQERRDIVVFYANKTADEIVYRDVLDQAAVSLGIKTVYVLSDKQKIPAGWLGVAGRLQATDIKAQVPDYQQRTYYLSGPHALVTGFEAVLKEMGLPASQIKTDFFPGFV